MARIALIILPVFGMAAIGYLAGRAGLLDERASRGLGDFVFKLALPIMLWYKLAQLHLPGVQLRGMVAYYCGAGLMFLLTATIARRLLKLPVEAAGALGMGAAFSNTVLLALPIVMKVHGEAGTVLLLLVISCHTTTLFTLGTIYVETGRAAGKGARELVGGIFSGLVRNPIIIGLVCGALTNLSGVPLPGPAAEIGEMFTRAAVPCALFAAGLSLCRFQLGGHMAHAALVVGLKLLVHPALMWVLARFVFHLEPMWTSVTVIAAGMPSGINAYLFATGYGAKEASVAAAVLASTGLGLVTATILLLLPL